MPNHKIDRNAEDIRRELTDILRSLKDPRITGFLTLVRVELSSDLSYCKVYVSSMEGYDAAKNAVKGLNNAAGYVRRELGSRLTMRKTPELKFIADDSIEHGADIARILQDIQTEREQHPVSPSEAVDRQTGQPSDQQASHKSGVSPE